MNSQKLLVLSDTHGNISALTAVFDWAKDGAFDTVVFLGDGIADFDRARKVTGFSCAQKDVRGNNDWGVYIPEADILEAGGHRLFLCHGHRYGLYGGYDILIAAARNMCAGAALFGHTHVPLYENKGGITLINPGSVGRPRSKEGASFAVLECMPETPLRVRFWCISPEGDIQEMPQK